MLSKKVDKITHTHTLTHISRLPLLAILGSNLKGEWYIHIIYLGI